MRGWVGLKTGMDASSSSSQGPSAYAADAPQP